MGQDRTVLEITGQDRIRFLQDLVTNDVSHIGPDLIYAALLSPQGKFLFDFFLFQEDDTVYLDVRTHDATNLAGRLNLYKLRADVKISLCDLRVSTGLDDRPSGAKTDPRHSSMGWRSYGQSCELADLSEWTAVRVENLIPEAGIELVSGESYILEIGFERLNGVDFRKGCYVGQEVTARMKHKAELKKGLVRVTLDGATNPGDAVERDGKAIGVIHSVAGRQALAYLRFDQAGDGMRAGDCFVSWDKSGA